MDLIALLAWAAGERLRAEMLGARQDASRARAPSPTKPAHRLRLVVGVDQDDGCE